MNFHIGPNYPSPTLHIPAETSLPVSDIERTEGEEFLSDDLESLDKPELIQQLRSLKIENERLEEQNKRCIDTVQLVYNQLMSQQIQSNKRHEEMLSITTKLQETIEKQRVDYEVHTSSLSERLDETTTRLRLVEEELVLERSESTLIKSTSDKLKIKSLSSREELKFAYEEIKKLEMEIKKLKNELKEQEESTNQSKESDEIPIPNKNKTAFQGCVDLLTSLCCK